MPVRARSRASRSSRKAPALSRSARSSSSSASKPGEITSPSRGAKAGSASSVRASLSARPAGAAAPSASCCASAAGRAAASAAARSSFGSASRSAASSRGRALFNAMRPAMRSMSGTCRRSSSSCTWAPWSSSASITSCRLAAGWRSRSGWCSQWRSRRLPMPVAQPSSSLNSVGPSSWRSGSVSSRLRRVAGSSATKSDSDSSRSVVT